MTYSRSRKLSDGEKKLQLLRSQLYGRNITSLNAKVPEKTSSPTTSVSTSEVNHLRGDLLKTTILASVIIGAQLLLYFNLKLY